MNKISLNSQYNQHLNKRNTGTVILATLLALAICNSVTAKTTLTTNQLLFSQSEAAATQAALAMFPVIEEASPREAAKAQAVLDRAAARAIKVDNAALKADRRAARAIQNQANRVAARIARSVSFSGFSDEADSGDSQTDETNIRNAMDLINTTKSR